MEPETIGIAQKPDTRDINGQIAITELLEMAASWMGMVACWWATMLVQGGIFFTNLKTKDCLFVIVIFLFTCFRHLFYFFPQAAWSLTGANRSLWTNNMKQLALSIGCISRFFYWGKLFSAITCAALSMMRLISQDFGQTNLANMASRNFGLNVFYALALIETLLLLVAFILRMLFERAKEENKEHKEEEKDDENEAEHEIIEIPDQTSTCIQQQDSSDPMLNNNGEGTSHTMTGKGAPVKFFCEENTRGRRKNHITASDESVSERQMDLFRQRLQELRSEGKSLETMKLQRLLLREYLKVGSEDRSLETSKLQEWVAILREWLAILGEWVAISLGSMVFLWAAIMLWKDHMFTLEAKDRMITTVIFVLASIRVVNSCLQVARRYRLGNNIQQHISGLFYWCQLVSALICVVLSMMGLVSQYYGQTEVTKMVSQRFVLTSFYCLTLSEALLSVPKIRYIRIMTMLQTFIDTITGWQTDQIKKFRQKYRRMVPTKASEHPVAFIPEQEKCEIIEKKTK